MSWGRIDDSFYDHPKFVSLPSRVREAAVGVWAMGNAYCNRHRTDGRIPRGYASEMYSPSSVKALVGAGLWHDRGDHYEVHDFLERNLSKAERAAKESASRERKARFLGEKRKRNAFQLRSSDETERVTDEEVERFSHTQSQSQSHTQSQTLNPPTPHGGDGGGIEDRASGVHAIPEADERTPAQKYREAYERGVAEGRGSIFACPRSQEGELHQAILAFGRGGTTGKPLRGQTLLDWIQAASADFAEWLKAESAKDPKQLGFYSSYGPRGLLKWLNERAASDEARRVV